MTQRIILTISQAHDLQNTSVEWPGQWAFLLDIQAPEKPDTLADPERMTAGLVMLERGCMDDQVTEQLGWKPDSSPLRQLRRLSKRGTRR